MTGRSQKPICIGEINRAGDKLEINYDWYEAVPFAYSHASDGGKLFFLDSNQKYGCIGIRTFA